MIGAVGDVSAVAVVAFCVESRGAVTIETLIVGNSLIQPLPLQLLSTLVLELRSQLVLELWLLYVLEQLLVVGGPW